MINSNNVKRLWELYDEYKTEYDKHYRDKDYDFEEYCESSIKQCDNCGEYYRDDEFSDEDWCHNDFIEGNICMQCMENGYGK